MGGLPSSGVSPPQPHLVTHCPYIEMPYDIIDDTKYMLRLPAYGGSCFTC